MENIKFDPTKLKIVPIDDVRPNSWNPKDKDTSEYKTLVRGIKEKGQLLPVYVRENEGYEIIDGEQRWRACKENNHTTVLIYNAGKLNDKEAKELTIWFQHQVPFNEVELASLIKSLSTDYKDLILPFDEHQIDNYIKMNDFNFDEFNDNKETIQEGGGDKFEMGVYKVTLEQKDIIDKAIEKVKEQAGDFKISEGKALELMAGDYLAGAIPDDKPEDKE